MTKQYLEEEALKWYCSFPIQIGVRQQLKKLLTYKRLSLWGW